MPPGPHEVGADAKKELSQPDELFRRGRERGLHTAGPSLGLDSEPNEEDQKESLIRMRLLAETLKPSIHPPQIMLVHEILD
eukprot:CAMPEP_0171521810 /NCGR_PEP_ID=MMETSP0959-20130129/7360_1 /TAXON_ID=87120 /ORGANISM="Aurantiochytrium limacinum, Strain ATCCMYA-1381" /LENGTH=80 /DNA_ID=CAMNT_0012061795 /DNA_START=295 /DNA_END=536 /DNA_ORIENTATION=+